jgi:hypothetical protein
VAAEKATRARVAPVRSGLKQFLQSRYGKNAPELQKFGFTPAKVPQRSVASKAAGIALSEATRTARNTMGKKQRLEVTGTVAAPAAPSPAPAPAVTAQAPAPVSHVSTTGGTQ